MNIYLHEVYTRTSAFNSSGEIYVLDNLSTTITQMYLDETVDLNLITNASLNHELSSSSIAIPYESTENIVGYERFYEFTGGTIVSQYTFKDSNSKLLKGAHFIKPESQVLLSPDNKNYPMGLKINKTFPGKNGYSLYNGAFVSYTPNQKHSITLNFDFLPEETYRKILELVDKKVLISAEPKENITLVEPSGDEGDSSSSSEVEIEVGLVNDGRRSFVVDLPGASAIIPTNMQMSNGNYFFMIGPTNLNSAVEFTEAITGVIEDSTTFDTVHFMYINIVDDMSDNVNLIDLFNDTSEVKFFIYGKNASQGGVELLRATNTGYMGMPQDNYWNVYVQDLGAGDFLQLAIDFEKVYEDYPSLDKAMFYYEDFANDKGYIYGINETEGIQLELHFTKNNETTKLIIGKKDTYYSLYTSPSGESEESSEEDTESTLPVVSPFEGKSFVCYLQDDSIDFDYTISVKQAGYKGSLTFLEA